MGNPLSKCCGSNNVAKKQTTTVSVDTNGNKVITTTTTTTTTTASSSSTTNETSTKVGPNDSVLKRISGSISSLTNSLVGGQKSQSIEQGLKVFPYPLTEEDRKILLANEIPASEIKNLSIGVDAGGMGIIHVAEWKGIKVAIKEASSQVISKEVDIYSRMKGSEGVVQFYGVTFPHGLEKLCIVTKYADSGSLTWHLKVAYHKLTWADKLRLASQIATGISHLHREGVFHRDLHGGNILIDDEGNAMLTDFGASTIMAERVVRNMDQYEIEPRLEADGHSNFISKRIEGLEAHQALAKDKVSDPLIGVMAYIAPERFRNPGSFDAKCDIYSLGVLLWELTSGHPAFAKVPQDVHLAVSIMNGKRELPVEGTPAEYKALYERCWASDPASRPSLDEILLTLKRIRESMTPEELAVTRKRTNITYESVAAYEESVSVPRPTSDIQQHFLDEC
ncbi:hypothetical protein BGZ94_010164 [Podila epigama]|nr:hypothetical protein BGZ94_010164 [Podila epigama]